MTVATAPVATSARATAATMIQRFRVMLVRRSRRASSSRRVVKHKRIMPGPRPGRQHFYGCRTSGRSPAAMARVPGAEPEGPAPDAPCSTQLAERGVSFRSRVVRNLLEARHVVLGRRPDEVVLKATGSGTGLVEDRAR